MTRTIHCRTCQKDLPVDAFRSDRIGPKTKRDRCRACNSKASHQWNLDHPARVKEIFINRAPKAYAKRAEWGRNNREYLANRHLEWRNSNRAAITASSTLKLVDNYDRLALRGTRLPPWANIDAIRAIYKEAKRQTKETGIPHQVDHIIPLRGRNVCGLHVESNLQIITKNENLKKKNSFQEAAD